MLKLFDRQQLSHDRLVAALHKYDAALDASDTGTGKTVKSAEVIKTLGLKTIIICPKACVPAWKRYVEMQGAAHHVTLIVNYEKIRRGMEDIYTTKPRKWEVTEPTLVVFDEVHACRNSKTQTSKLLEAAVNHPHIKVLMLSATAAKDPSDMFSIGYALRLHTRKNFIAWARTWGCVFNPWNQLVFQQSKLPLLEKLCAIIYPDRGDKISRSELAEHFAGVQVITDPIAFTNDSLIQATYDEMESELAELEERQASDRAICSLTTRLRARQKIELLKIPTLCELVIDAITQEKSVVVFLNFISSIDALRSRLPEVIKSVEVSGRAKSRQDAIDAFQENKVPVILVQIAAGGTGVSLHDVNGRERVSYLSPSDDAEKMIQAIGRTDRVGSLSDTIIYILFAAGTIEETISKSFDNKAARIRTLHQ